MSSLPKYIETLSFSLSHVLDDIGVNERMVLKRRKLYCLAEAIQTTTNGLRTYHIGSQSEGTTTIGLHSDLDTLICNSDFNVIQDYAEWKRGYINLLVIQDDITSPGYCRLQILKSDEPFPERDAMNQHCYVDAGGRILLENTTRKQEVTDQVGGVVCGPAYSKQGRSGFKDKDIVVGYPCYSWPNQARDWVHRSTCRWPCGAMRSNAEITGFFVVPVGSKISLFEPLEWRISTTLAERYLMFDLNITQIRCYVWMKMILRTHLHPISSFMCKTILLHCIEKTGAEIWRTNNLFTCLSSCLKLLYLSIRYKSLPHFIIRKNNLMAGQFTSEVYDNLLERIRYVMESKGKALLEIQTDDLGQALQNKTNVIWYGLQYLREPSPVVSLRDTCYNISAALIANLAYLISNHINLSLHNICEQSHYYGTILRTLRQTITKYSIPVRYIHGTSIQEPHDSPLPPFFYSIFGSVQASFDIATNKSVSPKALYWLKAGRNSDVSSGRLKLASVYYCTGDLLLSESLLREIDNLYNIDAVEPVCGCYSFFHSKIRRNFSRICYYHDDKAIKKACSFCIRFIQSEINCIPHELMYEMFWKSRQDQPHRSDDDYWMGVAVVDSLPFLFFLQYKIYCSLDRHNDKIRALTNLMTTVITEPNLHHRETAMNLLGQCMEQEHVPFTALVCYIMSLNIRKRNNVAIIHICKLLTHMYKSTQQHRS